MNKKLTFISFLFLGPISFLAQNYTSYFIGNTTDLVATPLGGIRLMGGASEDDNAMKWFLQQAGGGDVLVLRASGSDGYNDYLYSDLGIPVNSVETIVCHNASASNEAYIQQKIRQAEAIWFAGGDQWDYVSYWRNTPVDSLVNEAISQRKIVIGGTSAGMAILGQFYFSAKNGTVTSATALSNPYHAKVQVDSAAFIQNQYLTNTITDTHFDSPDRRGRLMVFLSRMFTDYGVQAKGIACDEYIAVCIDTTGLARVFGDFPSNDDNAYFVQTNCDLPEQGPEVCNTGTPLTWNRGGQAIKAYRIKGTSSGEKTFNLQNWKTGNGGEWLHWSAGNGAFFQEAGSAIVCNTSIDEFTNFARTTSIYPNPAQDWVNISVKDLEKNGYFFQILNAVGQKQPVRIHSGASDQIRLDISNFYPGVYFIQISDGKNYALARCFVRE